MATTLANLNSTINDRRRDTGSGSIDMTGDGFRAINGTLQVWNQMHDWEFQIADTSVTFNKGLTYYSLQSDYKAPIDVTYYKGSRNLQFAMTSAPNFDTTTLETRRFAIDTSSQVGYLRLEAAGDVSPILTATTTTDGTWVGATAISNVATDLYEHFDLGSSVSFDYSGTTGTLTVTGFNPIDLTRFRNRSAVVWNMYMASVTSWTSMTIKVGTDASNYYTGSVTTDYLGRVPTASVWNKFKVAWSALTTVGSPTITNITYFQLTLAFSVNPSATGFRIENIFATENVPITFTYYTSNMVTDSGTKTQIFTDAADTDDNPLWSGTWDWVTESFVNSALETIFWITGQYDDKKLAMDRITEIVNNLKVRMPSRRRYPEIKMTFD